MTYDLHACIQAFDSSSPLNIPIDDMPPGQTPHTVLVYAHNDLVDGVQPGDRVTVTGIYRATPLRLHPRVRNLKSVYKTHIDVVHFRKVDTKRLHGQEEG